MKGYTPRERVGLIMLILVVAGLFLTERLIDRAGCIRRERPEERGVVVRDSNRYRGSVYVESEKGEWIGRKDRSEGHRRSDSIRDIQKDRKRFDNDKNGKRKRRKSTARKGGSKSVKKKERSSGGERSLRDEEVSKKE